MRSIARGNIALLLVSPKPASAMMPTQKSRTKHPMTPPTKIYELRCDIFTSFSDNTFSGFAEILWRHYTSLANRSANAG
jgi:hypothetical protein